MTCKGIDVRGGYANLWNEANGGYALALDTVLIEGFGGGHPRDVELQPTTSNNGIIYLANGVHMTVGDANDDADFLKINGGNAGGPWYSVAAFNSPGCYL